MGRGAMLFIYWSRVAWVWYHWFMRRGAVMRLVRGSRCCGCDCLIKVAVSSLIMLLRERGASWRRQLTNREVHALLFVSAKQIKKKIKHPLDFFSQFVLCDIRSVHDVSIERI